MKSDPTQAHDPRVGQVLALVAIILLALALRLFRLGAGSIWYDEGVSLYLAGLSIPALVAHTAGDIHPPLYYILLHVWLRLAGNSQFVAAFFSLFFGILLIPATYLLARRLLGAQVALLAALLVALSPYHLWYSQEMRMYTLGALLGVLSFYFLLRALSPAPNPLSLSRRVTPREGVRSWLPYVLCTVLGLYSLYYFVFLLVFENLAVFVWWLAARRRRWPATPDIRAWILSQIAVLLLYLPWLPVAIRQATQPPVPPWRGFTAPASLLVESWTALSLGQSVQAGAVAFVLILVLCLYLAALLHKDEGRPAAWLLAGYTFVPLLSIYIASLVTPLYHVRYVFLYAPAFAIVLARGLSLVQRYSRLVGGLALALIVLASLRSIQAYAYDPAYGPDDQRGAVAYIARNARPGDAVLIDAGYAYPTFLYYYPGNIAWRGRLTDDATGNPPSGDGVTVLQSGSIGGSSTLGWGSPTSDFYATTEAETVAALDAVATGHERLWLMRIYDTVTDPQGFIRSYLNQKFLALDDAGFGGASSMRVQLYRTHRDALSAAPAMSQTVNANFDNQMRLLGYDVEQPLHSAGTSYLTTWWQSIKPSADLRAFVGLVDGSGREWAHWDDLPAGPLYPTSRWAPGEVVRQVWRLDVPPGTPPGQYGLQAGLYDAATGARLDVLDSTGRSTGTVARLGNVQVDKAQGPLALKDLPIKQRVGTALGGEVRLIGYNLGSRLAKPGERIDLSAYWQGIKSAIGERTVFVQLLDNAGKVWAAWEGPMAAAWDAGEVIRDQYSLLVPADAPDGEMRLVAGIFRTDDKTRLPAERGLLGLLGGNADTIDLGKIRVAGREHMFAAPAMPHTSGARFGDQAVLLGYRLAPDTQAALHPGDTLDLTLYWQALQQMDTSYTVFTQLLGPGDRVAAQHDAVPGDGLLPTTSWVSGEVLVDPHRLTVRPDAVPGSYRLVVGLYDVASGARLPVFVDGVRQPGDMLVLQTVTVQ